MKHPQDKQERRSIEARALESRMFRQRKINAKKRKIKTSIVEKETEDELRALRYYPLEVEPGGPGSPEAV
jgi:hypothetical protein